MANFGKKIGEDSFTYPVGFPNPNGSSGLSSGKGENLALQEAFYASGPFHNYLRSTDVNNSGHTTSSDALVVINALAQHNNSIPAFLDVNADNKVSALDALLVINALREQSYAEGESSADLVTIDYVAPSLERFEDELDTSMASDGFVATKPKLVSAGKVSSWGAEADAFESFDDEFSDTLFDIDGIEEISEDLAMLL